MSDFRFDCPHCRQRLKLDISSSLVGSEVACPTCSGRLIVPEPQAVQPVVQTSGTDAGRICPYCRVDITPAERTRVCPSCHTPHHADCWSENKGCTVFGCSMAPPDEEKISIIDSPRQADVFAPINTPVESSQQSTNSPTGPQVRPWVRYWARVLDFFLFSVVACIVLAIIYPPALEIKDVVLSFLLMFAYAFFEAAMLSTWGSTPGKALLRIRLRKVNGSIPSYGEALSRAFSVWASGCGLGIPIVALFTNVSAYRKLKNDGITSWDKDGGFRVSHKSIEAGRGVVCVAILVVMTFVILLSAAK